MRDVLDGVEYGRWTGADPEFRFKLKSTHGRRLVAKIDIVGATLQQNGPKEITWFVNGRQLARTRYDHEGEQLVSLPVPDVLLSGGEFVTVEMRVENPFIGEDKVKLGVRLMEIGFR